jgi:ABC-type transport system substrate-binding protein
MRSIRMRPDPASRARRLAPAALAACAAGLLAFPLGCGRALPAPLHSARDDGAPPRRGGTLHLATFGDIRGLDPAGPVDGLSLAAIHLIFAGLVDYDAQGRPVPELADHWDIADDGRTYRFVLRQGVAMQDGAELTADDVKRSVERALHPSTPDPYASYYTGIVGERAYAAGQTAHIEGVTVEGRYVVSFHLEEPDATFLYLVAMHTLRPTCKSAGDRYVDAWLPCGAGPFKLEPGGWHRGVGLRLVRHEGYFRPGRPYLDAVEWTYNMGFIAQKLRFQSGELDVARELTEPDIARYRADARWRPFGLVEADTTVYGESMNTRMPPFDDVEIRRAVAAAIDRDHYRLTQPSRMTVLTQALPGSLADPSLSGQRHDYAAALEHMRKAGYPYDPATGEGGWPQPIEYVLYGQGAVQFTAQLLQQDLAKVGLRIELKLVSYPTFLTLQERAGGAAMSQGNWQLDYPDPSAVLDPLFSTGAIAPEGSFNTAFYSNARVDDLLARAHREMDPDKRRTLYREADALLCDEAPWAFTFGFHFFDVRQPYVHGLVASPTGIFDVSGVWLDRAGDALERALGGAFR